MDRPIINLKQLFNLKLLSLSSSKTNLTGIKTIKHRLLSIILTLILLLFKLSNAHLVGECNFDRHSTGCFSQANLICEIETNTCKCHPDFPILVEHRMCVKRLRLNDICNYNEQCDNSKGLYCSFSDFRLVNNSFPNEDNHKNIEQTPRCRFVSEELISAQLISTGSQKEFQYRQYQFLRNYHFQRPGRGNPNHIINNNNNNNLNSNNYNNINNNNKHSEQQYSTPRLVWILLLASLIGLFFILFLLKSQYYRGHLTNDHQSSRMSDYGETDVPPPYEVAIRMKI